MNVFTEHHLLPEPWTKSAACAEVSGEFFFPEHGDKESARVARRICGTCDVATQCEEYAIRTRQRYGIWSGRLARTLLNSNRRTE